jgi:hypothetical protein
MRVLFVMRHAGYVRNFESTLRALCERGHSVHLAFERSLKHHALDPSDVAAQLASRYANLTHGTIPARHGVWGAAADDVRRRLDYLRYLEPEYRQAHKLRMRAARNMTREFVRQTTTGVGATAFGRWAIGRWLRLLHRAVPPDPEITAYIRGQAPDVLALTPLIEPGAPQAEYVRSARALGVPTALCVASWDNLTNKGLIHGPVDLVTVWNQAMRQEAIRLHDTPADRVVVTGAAAFDHWFGRVAATTREQFCTRVGLSPDQPFVLYLCSSRFVAPVETPFVRAWVERIRQAASPAIRELGILIRPHPQNFAQWRGVDPGGWSEGGDVVIWPPAGEAPVDEQSRNDYFDSMYHSAAVVGINTTGEIESAIAGRSVFTVLAPEFRDTQEGTLHFHHLRDIGGGLVRVARHLDEHVAQLEDARRDPLAGERQRRRFVEAFVRPHGLDVPATPRMVEALERLAAAGRARRRREPVWAPLLRPVLVRWGQGLLDARAREIADRRRRAEDGGAKARARATRAAARAAKTPGAPRRTGSRPFNTYVRTRQRVKRMVSDKGPAPTPREARMLAGLAHVWDASPATVTQLRRHVAGVFGALDTTDTSDEQLRSTVRDLTRSAGPDLLVAEPFVLGGFGTRIRGQLLNQDTVRFYRLLAALEDAAVLGSFRRASRRPTVWEIGGGWGGFAYQFKTLFPDVTYVITAAPEQLLVCAVYLQTLFPDANCRFFAGQAREGFWEDWERVDFAFLPELRLGKVEPPSLELTVDVLALEQMSEDRARAHVRRAYDAGSRYIVSLSSPPLSAEALSAEALATAGPDASAEAATTDVLPLLDRRFWRHPAVGSAYQRKLLVQRDDRDAGRRFYVGWRRLMS